MATEFILKLQEYRTPGSRVFSGRPRGKSVREKSNIDSIETKYSRIKIEIPSDIGSINPSFLEEFLFNVVSRLGKVGFYKKFEFVSLGRYNIEEDLSEAIDHILKKENALVLA
jgi:hypothetical protein